jgi:hypothetical protein
VFLFLALRFAYAKSEMVDTGTAEGCRGRRGEDVWETCDISLHIAGGGSAIRIWGAGMRGVSDAHADV